MRLGCILILLLLVPVLLGAGAKKKGGDTHTDGANCSAGEIALGVDEDGAVQGCYVPTYTLLGSTHSDTVTDAVTRGSLIYGNATPKWDELVKGADGSVLFATALDIGWTNTPILDGTWTWGDGINLCFGDVGDACISYDTTNLLINPKHVAGDGYTDFTNAIMVSVDENKFSQFGETPALQAVNDSKDRLVVTKGRTTNVNANRRAMSIVGEAAGTYAMTNGQTFGLEALAGTIDGSDISGTTTSGGGSFAAGTFFAKNQGAGQITLMGGVTSFTGISGALEDGTIVTGYALWDEGGDGGAGTGSITTYEGLGIKDGIGNITNKIGVHVDDLTVGTNTSIGMQIDGAEKYVLWLGAGADNTDAVNGITFGSSADTNAYRGAANQLWTDDDFVSALGVLFFQETTTPTPIANYGAIYTKNNNELFFQDGAGTEHLLHGDSFSNIWFHDATPVASATEVAISTEDTFTKIDSFTVVGHEDDLANLVGSSANDNLTLSSIGGGEYEISFHASVTATGGADKEMMVALGITLATAKDITNVTDDTITPIVITSTAHGLENGDMVEIAGVLVNTAANGSFIVDSKATDTFEIIALDGTATTGNGNYDEGTPTGDVTIEYPGNMVTRTEVRGATLVAISATGVHILANSDVLAMYVANLDGVTNLTVAAVSLDAVRVGD